MSQQDTCERVALIRSLGLGEEDVMKAVAAADDPVVIELVGLVGGGEVTENLKGALKYALQYLVKSLDEVIVEKEEILQRRCEEVKVVIRGLEEYFNGVKLPLPTTQTPFTLLDHLQHLCIQNVDRIVEKQREEICDTTERVYLLAERYQIPVVKIDDTTPSLQYDIPNLCNEIITKFVARCGVTATSDEHTATDMTMEDVTGYEKLPDVVARLDLEVAKVNARIIDTEKRFVECAVRCDELKGGFDVAARAVVNCVERVKRVAEGVNCPVDVKSCLESIGRGVDRDMLAIREEVSDHTVGEKEFANLIFKRNVVTKIKEVVKHIEVPSFVRQSPPCHGLTITHLPSQSQCYSDTSPSPISPPTGTFLHAIRPRSIASHPPGSDRALHIKPFHLAPSTSKLLTRPRTSTKRGILRSEAHGGVNQLHTYVIH